MYELYALLDPNNNKIRYIGYTSNPKNRLKEHIISSIGKSRNNISHKSNWIKSLKRQDKEPIYKTLIVTNSLEEIKIIEIDYIKYFKNIYNLTNNTKGGDGVNGLKWSEESKSKIKGRRIPRSGEMLKIRAFNIKSGEQKIFENKIEASKYIGCSPSSIISVSCGIRETVYDWKVETIKREERSSYYSTRNASSI